MSNLRPTFHESWYRVADLKARLRPSAQISRQYYRGERWYVVRDPAGNQYHRLSSAAYRFVGLLDGSRTVAQAWDLAGGIMADDAPTQPEVVQILTQLHAANLLEADVTADAGVLLRRHKKMMKKRAQGRLMNIMFPRIPLWDLDSFLVRWLPVMRLLLSKFGMILWLVVVTWAAVLLVPHWKELWNGGEKAIAPGNWPWLWATFCGIKFIHELGHAFMCRRFGGEVHELGIMFLVFVPAPYVDASSAWSLPSKWQRVLVGAGGMIFELFVAAICAFVWLNTNPDTLINSLAYNTMLIASVSTILFNANPLLRYDGYYMLSDWLEIPNLKQKSGEYMWGLFKRHLFRVKNPMPLPPIGQRFWLLLYAITSGAYRVFVGIMIILVVSAQVPVLGILMAIGGVITWLVVPVWKTTKYLLLEPELHRKRGRAVAWTTGIVGAIAFAIGVLRMPVRVEAEAITKAEFEQTVRSKQPGFVQRVLVRDGQRVEAGQALVECAEPMLAADVARQRSKIDESAAKIQALTASPGEQAVERANYAGLVKELGYLEKQRQELTVRAPFAGVVIAPRINELEGRFLKKGEEVATVIDARRLHVKAVVSQSDAALMFMDERVWNPIKGLNTGWEASPAEVADYLTKAGAKFEETPSPAVRQPGELVTRISARGASVVFDRPADVEFGFEYNKLKFVTATFEGYGPASKADARGAYDDIAAAHEKQFGPPSAATKPAATQAAVTSKPVLAGRSAHWLAEVGDAALDVDLIEQGGRATVTYRLLGRKVELRLATARDKTLVGRIVTRVPAATAMLPHAALGFSGGGSSQTDPQDEKQLRTTQPQFTIVIELDNPLVEGEANGRPARFEHLPGQRAYVRFTMDTDRSLLWQWGRKFFQLLQTQNATNKWL